MLRFFSYISLFVIFLLFSLNLYSKDCLKPIMPTNEEWDLWVEEVKREALQLNISQKTINLELSDIFPQEKIIMRDRCQPESTITLEEYLYYRVDKARIVAGKNMLNKYKSELDNSPKNLDILSKFATGLLPFPSEAQAEIIYDIYENLIDIGWIIPK